VFPTNLTLRAAFQFPLKSLATGVGRKIAITFRSHYSSRQCDGYIRKKPHLLSAQPFCWKWILCEWRLRQCGLSDDNWDDVITDWTVNYIVSGGSAALSTARQTNGVLSSTFALWWNAVVHLRPASITHRNTLLPATAAAAASATGVYKLKTDIVLVYLFSVSILSLSFCHSRSPLACAYPCRRWSYITVFFASLLLSATSGYTASVAVVKLGSDY